MSKKVDENQRVREWERLIEECKHRPNDMNLDTWCKQAGVSRSNYYYWSQRLKRGCGTREDNENVRDEDEKPQIVRVPDILTSVGRTGLESRLEICIGKFKLMVTEDTSKELLREVLEVLSYVK